MITINIPYSKSISNRLLIIHFLSKSTIALTHLSQADDTLLLKGILEKISNQQSTNFHTHNAGTTTRFLIALLSATKGNWQINADERMNQRPIIPLIEALKELGAEIKTASQTKTFPLEIKGKNLQGGKTIEIPSTQSSQILSAIAMIAPYCKGGLKIKYPENQTSLSYLEMTLEMMKRYGINLEQKDNIIDIKQGTYKIEEETFEADWSSASFFYALVAIEKQKKIFIPQLKANSLQGDRIIKDIFQKTFSVATTFNQDGAIIEYCADLEKQPQEIDFTTCPDLFLPVLIADVCTDSQLSYKGLQTLNLKESQRLDKSIEQLQQFGIKSIENNEVLTIDKTQICFDNTPKQIKTYQDHRMAMAFSLLSLKNKTINIENPQCVSKSFPNFWQEIKKITSTIS
jgi:3-phosphoshikimate 1-carboxyvinyltransferase